MYHVALSGLTSTVQEIGSRSGASFAVYQRYPLNAIGLRRSTRKYWPLGAPASHLVTVSLSISRSGPPVGPLWDVAYVSVSVGQGTYTPSRKSWNSETPGFCPPVRVDVTVNRT